MANLFENDGRTLKVQMRLDKENVSECLPAIIIEYLCGKYNLSMDSQKHLEEDFYRDKVYKKIDNILDEYEEVAKEYKKIFG